MATPTNDPSDEEIADLNPVARVAHLAKLKADRARRMEERKRTIQNKRTAQIADLPVDPGAHRGKKVRSATTKVTKPKNGRGRKPANPDRTTKDKQRDIASKPGRQLRDAVENMRGNWDIMKDGNIPHNYKCKPNPVNRLVFGVWSLQVHVMHAFGKHWEENGPVIKPLIDGWKATFTQGRYQTTFDDMFAFYDGINKKARNIVGGKPKLSKWSPYGTEPWNGYGFDDDDDE
ncbi:hypothetical protein CAC42_5318 [Sphaceloma murrayae]|uniref:Uncharacterized protein n=1 Tax=Sphaceloma murrayae TaxID=2082308 RepID=A0A2K1QUT2_9PEZI|nr:hypothetical protein CAC42_5318 [Sphaceloma murrayae]